MFEQQFTGGEPGDQAPLPGEPETSEGAPGPDDIDLGTDKAGEDDASEAGEEPMSDEPMSDELGEVAGGSEISELGPTA